MAEQTWVGPAPDPSACRAQVARIIASPHFDATDRDRRFLAYIVDEALAGRADRIKAYTIALEVFGRDASFDPQTDPIVRVEAGHLRRAIDRYYLSAGRCDPVVISVPKGGYAPSFVLREPEEAAPVAQPAPGASGPPWLRKSAAVYGMVALSFALGILVAHLLRKGEPAGPDVPSVSVSPLRAPDGDAVAVAFGEELGGEIVAEIARFRDIVVVEPPESASPESARYLIEGGIARDGADIGVQLRLRRSEDGAVIWAQRYRADLDEERSFAAQARIASLAATAIGQPYGAVFQADASARAGRQVERGDAYACTLDYFAFRATLDAASYRTARDCLDASVARFPAYATARALRAQIEVDGRRFGFAPEASYEAALAEARRALVLDPANIRAHEAKMMALYLVGDIDGALRVGAAAVEINPNDTEMLGEYGYRLALAGRWDEGCPIMADALARNPGPMPYYETGLALCAYIAGDASDAAARIRSAAFPQVAIYHLIAAALYAEAGESAAATAERVWIEENAPGLRRDFPALIGPRVGRPEDLAKFFGSLRRAGIVPPGGAPDAPPG